MKRAILLLYVLVITATISIAMNLGDDLVERTAQSLSMSKKDVQLCLDKTNVTVTDMMELDRIVDDDVHTVEFDNSALKIGCLITCLLQTKGLMSASRMNIDKIKQEMQTRANAEYAAWVNQVYDICNERVKSKTNECEVSLKFVLCMADKHRERHTNII